MKPELGYAPRPVRFLRCLRDGATFSARLFFRLGRACPECHDDRVRFLSEREAEARGLV